MSREARLRTGLECKVYNKLVNRPAKEAVDRSRLKAGLG
jgi:hypothetical protein